MRQRGIEDTPIDDNDESALVPPGEGGDDDDDDDEDFDSEASDPGKRLPEHGTLEGDRKPSAPPEDKLYPRV